MQDVTRLLITFVIVPVLFLLYKFFACLFPSKKKEYNLLLYSVFQ